jgi:hypothetical protein
MLEVSATPGWLRPVQYLDPSTAPVPSFTMAEAAAGVKSRLSGDDGSLVGGGAKQFCLDMSADTWTHTRQVDFGDGGHTSISLRVMVASPAVMSMHLDSLTAAPAATCAVGAPGSSWKTVTCALPADNPLRGVHDLWFSVGHAAGSPKNSPAPVVVPAEPGCEVSSQDSICYADSVSSRTLNGANPGGNAPVVGAPWPMTPEFCAWQCHRLNFSLAGTEFGHECYCANELSGRPQVLAQSHCAMPCSGKRTKTSPVATCGGFNAVAVFRVNCSGPVPAPCFPNGTAGPPLPPPPPAPPSPIVAFAWWKLQGGAEFISRTPPKTQVPVNISAAAATGLLPVGTVGNKLAAGLDVKHASIVLEDNEDGTYALRVDTPNGHAYACAAADATRDAELVLTAKAPNQTCARFRLQVVKDPPGVIAAGNRFALRSASVGLWVSACSTTHTQGVCPLTVTTSNPLEDARAVFTVDALRGDQMVPPH